MSRDEFTAHDPFFSRRSLCVILGEHALQESGVQEAIAGVQARGHTVEVRPIEQPGQGIELAGEAARSGQFDALAAVGGDGTLHEVINGLLQSDSPRPTSVGVVPFGTANDFALANGIPSDNLSAALNMIAEGPAIEIDVGRADGRFFINTATGGAAADVTAEAPDSWKQALGKFAYFLCGLREAATAQATPVKLEGPDFHWEGPALTLVVSNSRRAGGGVQVAPHALLNDGLLDLLVVPEMSLVELTPIVLDLLSDRPGLESPNILYRQLPWLDVEATTPLRVNLDGQPTQNPRFRFEIAPARLQFHLPPDAATLRPAVRAEVVVP